MQKNKKTTYELDDGFCNCLPIIHSVMVAYFGIRMPKAEEEFRGREELKRTAAAKNTRLIPRICRSKYSALSYAEQKKTYCLLSYLSSGPIIVQIHETSGITFDFTCIEKFPGKFHAKIDVGRTAAPFPCLLMLLQLLAIRQMFTMC